MILHFHKDRKVWKEIRRAGKKIVQSGLTHSHFGNISVRRGSKIFITTRGSMLDDIGKKEVVEVDLYEVKESDGIASSETVVHRSIYQGTPASAIIHAHSPFAVIQSMLCPGDTLVPNDCESKYFLQEIPIVTGEIGSRELAENATRALKDHKGVIIKGHGSIAIGSSLVEAFLIACSIEHACKLKCFVDLISNISQK